MTCEFYASAISGTEQVLCEELRELGFRSVRLNRGGIPFRGRPEDGWRACLESRIAQRVFLLCGRFRAAGEQQLYDGICALDWRPYITPRQTLAVRAVCRSQVFGHSGHAALKAKDAIVDRIRAATGERPSIARADPDVSIFLYISDERVAVYLDLAGDPLHRRGYRQAAGAAPLRETLAAALLRLVGWDRRTPLLDPMCGSGTLPIEAASLAGGIAPGLARARFGFERWANFGPEQDQALRELRGVLRQQRGGSGPRIRAADSDPAMVALARENARRAGVRPAFRVADVGDLQGGERCMLLSNPPYGARLAADQDFIRRLAATVARLHGWRVALLAGTPDLRRTISLTPEACLPLQNGALPCELLIYEVP